MPISPAHLSFAEDGTPYSAEYDDVYHARAGGLGQARHVFLNGNGLPQRWQAAARFVILETGFGQGLNFLATWAAWKADPMRCARLDFLSVEKHPLRREDLAPLHQNLPELAPLAEELQRHWPELTPGFHRLEFENGQVVLTLAFGEAIACVPQFSSEIDAIYLDGFSPEKNPQMWSPRLLNEIALLSKPGTTLATWAVAAAVRDALSHAGFALERQPGFAGRNRMLVGHFPTPTDIPEYRRHQKTEAAPGSSTSLRRDAIVIGAGLAGSLIAERLCQRGWHVDLFDRQPAAAGETSGNLTAIMLPMLSLDDNRASRLNRACYLYALRQVARWQQSGEKIDGAACGVLHVTRDAEHEVKQHEILSRSQFPKSYVRWVDQAEACALAGAPVSSGGWWFGGGAWWNPVTLCQAALRQAGRNLRTHFSTSVERIEQDDNGDWSIFDVTGRRLATASQLVLACAHDILRLPQSAHLPLLRFRGQMTHLPAPADSPLKCVVCQEGYVSPRYREHICVGASFHRGGEPDLSESDHLANLARLESMLPGYAATLNSLDIAGRVGFRPISPDKLPMLGPLHQPDATPRGRDLSSVKRWQGLHVATGYGARGLSWSALMAELLASQINDDPLPVEADLAATVDPARFLLRKPPT